jgi:hypothetical protein
MADGQDKTVERMARAESKRFRDGIASIPMRTYHCPTLHCCCKTYKFSSVSTTKRQCPLHSAYAAADMIDVATIAMSRTHHFVKREHISMDVAPQSTRASPVTCQADGLWCASHRARKIKKNLRDSFTRLCTSSEKNCKSTVLEWRITAKNTPERTKCQSSNNVASGMLEKSANNPSVSAQTRAGRADISNSANAATSGGAGVSGRSERRREGEVLNLGCSRTQQWALARGHLDLWP